MTIPYPPLSVLYLLAMIALLVGTAAVYMALIKRFPVQWLYHHYFLRKPLVWGIFGTSLLWESWGIFQAGAFRWGSSVPLGLMGLAILLTHRLHQETAFPAVDFPEASEDPLQLPLTDDMQLAIIEREGVTKAYPLDYVIHHHIVNDRFGDSTVALTYCAMCRSIIAFDVTEIGALFVGSFKNANMIVADRRTTTFFQQATGESIIGSLHPHKLTMIPYQILPWSEVKQLEPLPQVAHVTQEDLREFQLPIPGVWKKIMGSEATPGLPSKLRDTSFPARTHVIGITDPIAEPKVAYLKGEVVEQGIVKNEALDAYLVAHGETVNAFKGSVEGEAVDLVRNADGTLSDTRSETLWDARGDYQRGPITSDLEPIMISDEYWFSWKEFHPDSQLIRLEEAG